MARYLTAAFLLQIGTLVLALSCTTNCLSLEDQVQQLTENYDKITAILAAKNAQLEVLELKVVRLESYNEVQKQIAHEQEIKLTRLEATVQQQESILTALKNKRLTNHEIIPNNLASKTQTSVGKSIFPRTCREVRAADPSLSSGMHWIDPDGQGVGDDPIYVYCDMTKGSTLILHDSESSTDVGHCADPGCYSRPINYDATMRQIKALADLSNECHQSIQYDCNYAPFETNGVTYAWWNDRNGNSQTFWAGSNASVHTCQCGIDKNCVEAFTTCNCDSTVPVPLTDSGIITDKSYLPITRLNFGRTQLESSSGVHTLGRFECSGQVAVSGMPSSCTDLWRIGHALSGLYSVMGSTQVESVSCDFTKLPDESGFQTWIGFVDVKSLPVYFYVQKSTTFSTYNVPIPFEIERLNVGGAMDLESGIFTAPRPGIYFFSFSGNAVDTTLHVYLYLNGNRIGDGHSSHDRSVHQSVTLRSTLRLKTGDQISLRILDESNGLSDDVNHYTHYTGWLLQEDLDLSF